MKLKNKKTICVDYHFHANLPKSDKSAEKHIKRYWEKLVEAGVDVVISTEHVYKNPQRAYQFMKKFQPENHLVFPGMEYLTKEGVDIVIFSESDNVYSYKELWPYKMTLNETIKFVKKNNLKTFITHPYLKSKTGIVYNLGKEEFLKKIKEVKSIEVISGNFLKQKVFRWILENQKPKNSFPLKIDSTKGEFYIPRDDIDLKELDFIAVGSDAHQFGEVGNCLKLEYDGEDILERITNSKNGEIFVRPRQHTLFSLIKAPIIIIGEALKKKFYKYNLIKQK